MMDRFVTALLDHILNLKPNTVISLSAEIHSFDPDPLCEIECVEEIALGIRKRQAFPLLEYTTTNLRNRFFSELSPQLISQKPTYFDKMNELIDVYMEIGWNSLAEASHSEDPDKEATLRTSERKVIEEILQQNKHMVLINSPTETLAQQCGMAYHTLLLLYLDAVCTNYGLLKVRTEESMKEFFTARDYLLTTEMGELSISIERENCQRSAGFLPEEQIIALPAGCVTCPARRSSIHGEILAQRLYYGTKTYHNVKLRFDHGSIRFVTISDDRNVNFDLHNALSGSAETCYLMYGCNRDLLEFTGYSLYDRCIDDSVMLRFYDMNNQPVDIATKAGKLKKIKI
ncbi:MAG: hypothetical protein J7K89_00210 [Candidatus Cloacimonetes bacterium]|nr:hypothetical protein [Candidatus Cloacimonadota bacterium]